MVGAAAAEDGDGEEGSYDEEDEGTYDDEPDGELTETAAEDASWALRPADALVTTIDQEDVDDEEKYAHDSDEYDEERQRWRQEDESEYPSRRDLEGLAAERGEVYDSQAEDEEDEQEQGGEDHAQEAPVPADVAGGASTKDEQIVGGAEENLAGLRIR